MTNDPDHAGDLRPALRARALSMGLDRIGFTEAAVPPEASHFDDWLARSHHGTMEWMRRGRDRRMDPQRLLHGAQSFVVAAQSYTGHEANQPPDRGTPEADGAPRGFVARYARGADYHRDLLGKLRELAHFIEAERPGHRALEYVDTGAILERMWAARAGIGWIGKNAMVLNAEMGSWFCLGVIITTVAIPPDEPAMDQCGSCTLCLDACPTGAIVEDRVVDSRRCLSYHTIELRGPHPEEFRKHLGERVFGCDDCQEVCPWNGAKNTVPSPAAGPSLFDLIEMTAADYDERFPRSAIRRATMQGLRRNAVAALGNAHPSHEDSEAWIARLERIASDPGEDTVVREQADWSAGQLRAFKEWNLRREEP